MFKDPGNQLRQYDNPIPTRFLAPIDCLKIPAQYDSVTPAKDLVCLLSGCMRDKFAFI
jgi:hypothetical protein